MSIIEIVFQFYSKRKRRKAGLFMSLFDEIKTGLNEAIEYEKGNLKAKTTTVPIEPVGAYTSSEIKDIK